MGGAWEADSGWPGDYQGGRRAPGVMLPACPSSLATGPSPHATSSEPPSLRVISLTSQLCSLTSQNSRGELSPEGIKSGLLGTKPHT